MISSVEEITGKKLNISNKQNIIKGSDEIDLVRSGLDDTMRSAYIEISNRWHTKSNVKDLRISAMSIALEKIAMSYETLGI